MDNNPRQLSSAYADAEHGLRHVFVRDLALIAMVGIYEHEKRHPQRILVNIDCAVKEQGGELEDDIKNVVSYEKVVKNVKAIVQDGHVNLVETLAEKIADKVLRNRSIKRVRVRVEKLDIIPEASSVGIEIERTRGR
ncbi:MAG: dihydroneopterin aldolase [Pseudomonadota bacterium]